MLRSDFAECPPYTIQRLAELVLRPKRHYRYLPAYLRALDRVVSVSSPVSDFPLASHFSSANGGAITNGEPLQINGGFTEREGLGSDESLGGALLIPIKWLRHPNEILVPSTTSTTAAIEYPTDPTADAPAIANGALPRHSNSGPNSPTSPTLSEQSDASTNSASSLDTILREQGGLSQGELLRREQEAGVVPVDDPNRGLPRSVLSTASGAAASSASTAAGPMETAGYTSVVPGESRARGAGGEGAGDLEVDGPPHARGPAEIGVEDTGPQPPGRGSLSPKPVVEGEDEPEEKKVNVEGEKETVDAEGDVLVGDAGVEEVVEEE